MGETKLENEWLTELQVKKISMEEEIEWKAGKNITVEMKRVAAGKKGKNLKEKKVEKVDRNNFFRSFFRNITLDDPSEIQDLLDKTLLEMGFDTSEVDDEEELEQAYEDALEKVTDDAYEMGLCLRDNIIPFAVRWYTGQACSFEAERDDEDGDGDEDDDEDGDEDEVSDQIENESDEASEEDDGKAGGKGAKSPKRKPTAKKKKAGGAAGGGGSKKKEECNQQ